MSNYPIMLIVYNRLAHTRRTVEALAKNSLALDTDLYIFSDAPRLGSEQSVAETRAYLETIKGFKSVTIIKWQENKNVFKSTVDACNYMCGVAEAFIGLEDDIDTHPYFLQYMNDSLNFYKDNQQVGAVMGYCHQPAMDRALKNYEPDVLFSAAFHSYGWGCWSDRWEKVDLSPKAFNSFKKKASMWQKLKCNISTWNHAVSMRSAVKENSQLWDIRLSFYLYNNNLVCVWPATSYARTFGFDGSGLHSWVFTSGCFNFTLDTVNEEPAFTHDINRSLWFNFKVSTIIGINWLKAFISSYFNKLKRHSSQPTLVELSR